MLQEQFLNGLANREIIKKFCRGAGEFAKRRAQSENAIHAVRKAPCAMRLPPGRRRQEKLFNDYATFRDFLHKIGSNRVETVIFMDEFEHLPEKSFADETFFSNLRSAANHPDNLLAFVTISRTELKELTQRSTRASGFWNIFEPEIIGLLDTRSIDGLSKTTCLTQ